MAQNDEQTQKTETVETSKKVTFDGDFDPERASRLIETLRGEIKDLKAERSTLATSLQEKEDAEKSETQRLTDRLAAAETRAKEAERALFVTRAAHKHNLPDDVAEFLTGDSEEEIEAKAQRLARLGSPKTDEPEQRDDLPGRPHLALTPGHGGEPSAPFDPSAIAEAALQGR